MGSQGGGDEWLARNEGFKATKVDWEVQKEEITPWQLKKAAWLLSRLGQYRAMVERWVLRGCTC